MQMLVFFPYLEKSSFNGNPSLLRPIEAGQWSKKVLHVGPSVIPTAQQESDLDMTLHGSW